MHQNFLWFAIPVPRAASTLHSQSLSLSPSSLLPFLGRFSLLFCSSSSYIIGGERGRSVGRSLSSLAYERNRTHVTHSLSPLGERPDRPKHHLKGGGRGGGGEGLMPASISRPLLHAAKLQQLECDVLDQFGRLLRSKFVIRPCIAWLGS